MTKDQFHDSLKRFLHHKPFFPFVAELMNGKRIVIDRPNLAINNGGAGYFSAEEGLIDFSHEQVERFAFCTVDSSSNGYRPNGIANLDRSRMPMTRESFERELKSHWRRKPFLPFIIALIDGRRYLISHPTISFDGAVAGYLSETDGLIDFDFDEVDHFEIPVPELQT